jgi:cell division protein FtsQ
MRRKRTVKPSQYRSAAVVLVFVLASLTALAYVADQWRYGVAGVQVSVSGTEITTADDIIALTGVTDTTVLASMDLLAVRQSILGNPFVKDVEVTRDPPSTLVVAVTERTPMAMLLNVNGKDWLVDEDGFILPAVSSHAVHDLPVITGAEDADGLEPGTRVVQQKVQKALQVLRVADQVEKGLAAMISEVSLRQERDLVLYTLEGGVPVILGSPVRLEDKFRSFKAFWDNVAMKYDPMSLEYIDLRFRGQVVVKWRDEETRRLAHAAEMRADSLAQAELDTTQSIQLED